MVIIIIQILLDWIIIPFTGTRCVYSNNFLFSREARQYPVVVRACRSLRGDSQVFHPDMKPSVYEAIVIPSNTR